MYLRIKNCIIKFSIVIAITVFFFFLHKQLNTCNPFANPVGSHITITQHEYNRPIYMASVPTTGSVSVKSFGAKGDGITDDTTAFQNALKNLNGRILFVPKGTYIITSTILIPSNTAIAGDGETSILKACDGFPIGDDVLKIYNKSNISITNIAVDGNSTINNKAAGYSHLDGVHLLDIWNASNITIEKCHFKNNIYCAVRLIQGNTSNTFQKCTFKNVDCGIIALGSGNVSDLTVDNCSFDGHDNSESISLFGSGHYTDITISNNTIKNKRLGHAIFCAKGTIDNIKILNNKLYDNCYSIRLDRVDTAVISGNYINNSNSLSSNGGKGIMVTNSSNIEISNNTVTKTCAQAIYILECTNINAFSNNIVNCGYLSSDFIAFDIRGACDSISVYNNTFTRTDNKLSVYSVVTHSTGPVLVCDNKFANGQILLHSDSSNVTTSNNNTTVKNLGTNNTVK